MSALLPQHEQELITGSGIDPAIIAARGYRSITAHEALELGFADYQCRPGLLIPQITLAGVPVGYLLKPDVPRMGKRGKTVKYEPPVGSVPHFDMHPGALPALTDVAQTLYFTEGNKKADAAWSRGLPCVSVTGVWQFVNKRYARPVVPDLDEIPLYGRRVRVVFDSDVTRKPEVAQALLRFCSALARRGADVEVIYLPEGPDGAKVGLDDWFVAGGTVDELDALARPWDGIVPGGRVHDTHTDGDTGALQAELAEAKALNSALVQTFLNPHLTHAEKMAAIAVATLAAAKRAAGDVDPDGQVALSPSEVADDWRATPAKGDHVSPVNPKSGTKPRMPRSSVRPILKAAIERGILTAEVRGTLRRRDDGSSYKDWELIIEPERSLANALDPWARWTPDTPKVRKPRDARTCRHCGEVHDVVRREYCAGCGGLVREPTTVPASPMSKIIFDIGTQGTGSPSSPVVRNVENNFRDAGTLPEEPAWVADAPDFAFVEDLSPSRAPDAYATSNAFQGDALTRPSASPDPWDTPPSNCATPQRCLGRGGCGVFQRTGQCLLVAPEPAPTGVSAVRELIATASHAPTAQEQKQALQAVGAQLTINARARGRTPVPKPVPHTLAEQQPDPWTGDLFPPEDAPRSSFHFSAD